MKKKAIAILLLLAVMFCAFAEEKTLNVNLSIVPIFEVKWTGTQLTEDNAKTTSLDSLSAPDPIVLNSDNNYTSKSTIYASWRTNYAQPLTVKITPEKPLPYKGDGRHHRGGYGKGRNNRGRGNGNYRHRNNTHNYRHNGNRGKRGRGNGHEFIIKNKKD